MLRASINKTLFFKNPYAAIIINFGQNIYTSSILESLWGIIISARQKFLKYC